MSDPYYRTFEGFRCLLLKDWISLHHNFIRNSGLLLLAGDGEVARGEFISTEMRQSQAQMSNWDNIVNNKECAMILVFFLDCVSQLLRMNPMQFEFRQDYLLHLAFSCHSNKFFETTTPIMSIDFSGKKELQEDLNLLTMFRGHSAAGK